MKIRMKKHTLVFLILLTLLVGFIGGLYIAEQPAAPKTISTISTKPLEGSHEVTTKIPAVDTSGNGVIGQLITTVNPGTGRVSVDIDVLSYVDTQLSAKTAVDVARNYTGIDTGFDINYAFKINATAVEGGSAGGAMAVSAIAALQNRSLNSSVMMTGTIEDDGTVGKIGAVQEKARAAKRAGAELFLVPEGQGTTTELRRSKECRPVGSLNYCEVKYTQTEVNIGEIVGISVVAVRNVRDAARYMVV